MLKRFFAVLFVCILLGCPYSNAAEKNNNLEISNSYFSFIMPDNTKDTYIVEKYDNGIYICEKISKKAGMSGFAFGLKIYKSSKEYVDFDGVKKIGELVDKKGIIYDMVLVRPTEIRYGDGDKIQSDFNRLYNFGSIAGENIKGINGAVYYNNRGIKGDDLYGEILKKYKTAADENWNYSKYEKEGLNSFYLTLSKSNKKLLNKIGYTYYDINGDGIDELVMGEIKNGKLKGIIYDIYTTENRKPVRVLSVNRDKKYFVCNDNLLWCEYPPEKKIKTEEVLFIRKNSSEIIPRIKFVYDTTKNKNHPWYIIYGTSKGKEGVSEELFNNVKNNFSDLKRFDYTPLVEFD